MYIACNYMYSCVLCYVLCTSKVHSYVLAIVLPLVGHALYKYCM